MPDNANVLIDLDSVLDTRLPILLALHEPTAKDVMRNDHYRKRIKDTFGNIPYAIFNRFYSKRSKDVLIMATPTPMLELLKEYCIEAYTSLEAESEDVIPTLIVNTYPYTLANDEKLRLLKLFSASMPVKINIDIVDMDNDELNPKYISDNVSAFIKYDMINWLEYHNSMGRLTKHPLLNTSCVAPMIANGNKPSKEITQDDFDNLRSMFGPLTNLVLLQSRVFSTI